MRQLLQKLRFISWFQLMGEEFKSTNAIKSWRVPPSTKIKQQMKEHDQRSAPEEKRSQTLMSPSIIRIQPHSLLAFPHGLTQTSQPGQRRRAVAPISDTSRRHRNRAIIKTQRIGKVPSFITLIPQSLQLLRIHALHVPTSLHRLIAATAAWAHRLSLPAAAHYAPVAVVPHAGPQNIASTTPIRHHPHPGLQDLPRGADVPGGENIHRRRSSSLAGVYQRPRRGSRVGSRMTRFEATGGGAVLTRTRKLAGVVVVVVATTAVVSVTIGERRFGLSGNLVGPRSTREGPRWAWACTRRGCARGAQWRHRGAQIEFSEVRLVNVAGVVVAAERVAESIREGVHAGGMRHRFGAKGWAQNWSLGWKRRRRRRKKKPLLSLWGLVLAMGGRRRRGRAIIGKFWKRRHERKRKRERERERERRRKKERDGDLVI